MSEVNTPGAAGNEIVQGKEHAIRYEPINHLTERPYPIEVPSIWGNNWYKSHFCTNQEEVITRIGEHLEANIPSIIAPDSLTPDLSTQGEETYKDWVWFTLPGNPARLSRTGEVTVLSVDFIGGSGYGVFTDVNLADEFQDRVHSRERINSEDELYAAGALAVVGIMIGRGNGIGSGQKITRRQFLKWSLIATGALIGAKEAGVGKLSQMVSETLNEVAKNSYLSLIRTLESFPLDGAACVDGRTALIRLKSLEYLHRTNQNKDTPVSAVMGYDHTPGATRIWGDFEKEREAVFNYMWEIAGMVDHMSKIHREIDAEKALAEIYSIMAKVDVFSVKEPPAEPEGKTRPLSDLYASVNKKNEECFESLVISQLGNHILQYRREQHR